jgi:hypothetical protein
VRTSSALRSATERRSRPLSPTPGSVAMFTKSLYRVA